MLRLIDANLNRISEGLRLLEDIARFILNDAALSAALKSLRHELLRQHSSLQKELLSARDSAGDVAAFAEEDMHRADLPAIVTANARRVEESLRVLEEISKLPDLALDPAKFKQARFTLYELERALTGKILRVEKRIAGLYVIIDPEALGGRDEQEVCRQAIRGGAKAIQLRDKKRSRAEILAAVQKLGEVCAQYLSRQCSLQFVEGKARLIFSFAHHRSAQSWLEATGPPQAMGGPDYYKDPRNIGRWTEHRLKQLGMDMRSEEYDNTFSEVREMIDAAREGEMPEPLKDL